MEGSVKAPAFQFYAADFLADKNVAVMSGCEVGAYILLISYCWREGSLPDDHEELAVLARMPFEQFEKSWEKRLRRCFELSVEGQWVHPRLEEERAKQAENREKKQHAAHVRHGTTAKHRPEPTPQSDNANALHVQNTRNANVYQTQCPSPASSPSSATTTHTRSAGAREDDPSAFERGSPSEIITPPGGEPDELPPDLTNFALRMHWELYHVGIELDTQERVKAVVTDEGLWKQALDYWVDNDYRGRSIGKIVKKYRELEAEQNGKSGRAERNGVARTNGANVSARTERQDRGAEALIVGAADRLARAGRVRGGGEPPNS